MCKDSESRYSNKELLMQGSLRVGNYMIFKKVLREKSIKSSKEIKEMVSTNTLIKQGKLELKRANRIIEIPDRILETKEASNDKGEVKTTITKLAPIRFSNGRLKGSKEAIRLRKEVQRNRRGGDVIC